MEKSIKQVAATKNDIPRSISTVLPVLLDQNYGIIGILRNGSDSKITRREMESAILNEEQLFTVRLLIRESSLVQMTLTSTDFHNIAMLAEPTLLFSTAKSGRSWTRFVHGVCEYGGAILLIISTSKNEIFGSLIRG